MCFFFKQKTAYEMRISDWSSDVCSSDLKLPMFGVTTLEEQLYSSLDTDRLIARLVGFFGALALILACIGLYEIGRASCRERVCQFVSISVVAVSFNKKHYTSLILSLHSFSLLSLPHSQTLSTIII